MMIRDENLNRIYSDLGINKPYVKGSAIPVTDCWHFYTDGNAVDAIFSSDEDFQNGMNRIHTIAFQHNVLILAFCLMDTHIHFILYGPFEECNRFLHEYVRLTSFYISSRHGEQHKLAKLPIKFQSIDTDTYLKTAICYVLKNAPAGGLPYLYCDYPWSSGPLMFRRNTCWTVPLWLTALSDTNVSTVSGLGKRAKRSLLRTNGLVAENSRMIGNLVFPGDYVVFELAEKIFRSHKSFNYFLCRTKEMDIEEKGGTTSFLSIPMQEMRQHKNEFCMKLFGKTDIRSLNTSQRLMLARTLKAKYNSSVKQIIRLCGLRYDEVKDLL